MSFKSYKKGLRRKSGPEFVRFKGLAPSRKGFVELNPWWNRQRHPGWAAYHANKDRQ